MLSEKRVQYLIAKEFGSKPWCRIWRANTGVARTLDGKRVVRFGLPGQADLSGLLHGGKRLEIETKTATGKQRQDQIRFEQMITSMGGVYILARSVEDVYANSHIQDAEVGWVQGHRETEQAV